MKTISKLATLPKITIKQLEILLLLYKFRYLTTNHITKLLNHKEPQRIQAWLKDLNDKGYVNQRYSRNNYEDVITPAIYSLTKLSKRKLKENKKCDVRVLNRIYKDKTSSLKFIKDCLFLASIYLTLSAQTKGQEKLNFYTKADLVSFDYFPHPLPDAYIAIKTKEKTRRYFLELFDVIKPYYAIEDRVEQYIEYEVEGEWNSHTVDRLPSVLLVCPDEIIKRKLNRFISDQFTDLSFYLATRNSIKFGGIKNDTWKKVD